MGTVGQNKNNQAVQLPIPEIELLLCRRDVFTDWNFDRSITGMPYWRLYKTYNDCAVCRFNRDEAEVRLRPGELYLIAPDTEFDARAEGVLDKFYILFMIKGEFGHIQNQFFHFEDVAFLLTLCDRISARLLNRDNRSDDLALECCALIALAMTRIPKDQIRHHGEPNSELMRIFQLIARNPMMEFSNVELAQMAKMSRSVFCRKFTDCFGISPQKCIMEQRLKRAMILLLQSDLSISEIATGCGFCDRYHFTRTFQQYRQVTPAKFRKENPNFRAGGALPR